MFADCSDLSGTLVLGASGRIGHLLRHVWGPETPAIWQFRDATATGSITGPNTDAGADPHHVIFDPLSQPAALRQALRGRRTLLCLAGAVPGRSTDMADNIRLAQASLQAAGTCGARVVLCSSAAVYGRGAQGMGEGAALRPETPYGEAKAEMEARAMELGADLGVPVTSLRIGNIAGLDAILGGWHPGFKLDQFPDGQTPRRSYIGMRALADLLAHLMQQPDLPPVLNIAQPGAVAMGDLLCAADLAYVPRPASGRAIAEVALDLTRLRAHLRPAYDLAPADPNQLVAEWRALRQG